MELTSAFSRLNNLLTTRALRAEEPCLRATHATRGTAILHSIEIAGSGKTRSRGLLGRNSLEHGSGLWIVPCEAVHTFWMKFPIDLIYLDREFRIRKLRSDLPAWRLSACLSAHSVLEAPAGTIREAALVVGDRLDLSPLPEGEDSL